MRSGAATARIALGNGAMVELPPGSSVSLSGSIDLVLGRGGATKATRLDARSGEVAVIVPASAAKRAVLCASKDLLVVARAGANVRVRALPRTGGTPNLLVGVYGGEAHVASQGAWKVVPTAHMVELRADEHVADPTRPPGSKPAPRATSPRWRATPRTPTS